MEKVKKHLHTKKGKFSAAVLVLALAFLILVFGMFSFSDKPPYIENLNHQAQAPSPAPSSQPKMVTYTNNQYGFQFDYPADWQVGEFDTKNEKILHSILQVVPKGFKGDIPAIKLLFAPNPNHLSLQALELTFTPKSSFPIIYSPDDTYTLSGAGLPAYYRQDGNCGTAKCQIYTFSKDDKVYQLVTFLGVNSPNQVEIFNKVFNTFKFIKSTSTSTNSGSTTKP